MTIECDVLVVGAGPAGSSAARSAAMNGAKTIFIDKKEEIGVPVQCAEGIGEYLFPYLPFKIPKEQLIWQMDGMYFQTDDLSVERTGDLYRSYSVERKYFDKWLSKLAIEKGAELFTNTELKDLVLNEEYKVKIATVKKDDKTFDIKPKVLIAADGSESTVLKLLGLYNPKEGDLAEVYSWEMKNLDLYKPKLEQIFFGEFTPNGYAFIFPKSRTTANVGVGGIFPKKKMEKYFEEFLEFSHVKKQIKNAEYTLEKTKKAVWNDLTDKWVFGNVLIAGDAANQNIKPFIEGILPSITCGSFAGKNVSKLLIENNHTFQHYNILNSKFEEELSKSKEILYLMNNNFRKHNNKENLLLFSICINILDSSNYEKISKLSCKKLREHIKNSIETF